MENVDVNFKSRKVKYMKKMHLLYVLFMFGFD